MGRRDDHGVARGIADVVAGDVEGENVASVGRKERRAGVVDLGEGVTGGIAVDDGGHATDGEDVVDFDGVSPEEPTLGGRGGDDDAAGDVGGGDGLGDADVKADELSAVDPTVRVDVGEAVVGDAEERLRESGGREEEKKQSAHYICSDET